MTSDNTPSAPSGPLGKTVQDYIDETPVWADATPVHFSPITQMQWFIWGLAAAGQFFDGVGGLLSGCAPHRPGPGGAAGGWWCSWPASRSPSWRRSSAWGRPSGG